MITILFSDVNQPPQYTSTGSSVAHVSEGVHNTDMDFLSSHSHSVPQEAVYSNEPPGAPLPPRVVSVQSASGGSTGRSQQSAPQSVRTQSKSFVSTFLSL